MAIVDQVGVVKRVGWGDKGLCVSPFVSGLLERASMACMVVFMMVVV